MKVTVRTVTVANVLTAYDLGRIVEKRDTALHPIPEVVPPFFMNVQVHVQFLSHPFRIGQRRAKMGAFGALTVRKMMVFLHQIG
jgi:hypothetical protein